MNLSKIKFPRSIVVADQKVDISRLTQKQRNFYLELLRDVVRIYESRKKKRVIIGIAGPTGSGKSVIAALLTELSKQARLQFTLKSVSIDAFHHYNSYLLSHFNSGKPLKDFKGRFDTYDVKKLALALRAFSARKKLWLPSYSRKLHDPVEKSIYIKQPQSLLLIEGLWLLYKKRNWENVKKFLDFVFFIEADERRIRQNVIRRHIKGGRTNFDAKYFYHESDVKNFELVMRTKKEADKILPPYYRL